MIIQEFLQRTYDTLVLAQGAGNPLDGIVSTILMGERKEGVDTMLPLVLIRMPTITEIGNDADFKHNDRKQLTFTCTIDGVMDIGNDQTMDNWALLAAQLGERIANAIEMNPFLYKIIAGVITPDPATNINVCNSNLMVQSISYRMSENLRAFASVTFIFRSASIPLGGR